MKVLKRVDDFVMRQTYPALLIAIFLTWAVTFVSVKYL